MVCVVCELWCAVCGVWCGNLCGVVSDVVWCQVQSAQSVLV